MRPLVAIIGRPNVGKSTLFNRLSRKRSALVSNVPGLTRDWREGEMALGGTRIGLLDTAGLEEAAPGSVAARMRKQSETALRRSDLVLFVVDARAGVLPADAAFARIVRAAGIPAILVANKCEGRAGDGGFFSAFELGLGEPIAISAEHGEGIGELEVTIQAALGLKATDKPANGDEDDPDREATVAPRPIRVAIVGRPNSGKSTLVNALLGQERMITGPEPGLTRDAVATDFSWQGQDVRLFDTAGLRRKARVSDSAEKLAASDAIRVIRFAEVVILLADAQTPLEHQDLTIASSTEQEGRALVIGVNKWDLVLEKQKTLKHLRDTAERSLPQLAGISVLPISALAGRGLDQLMEAVFQSYARWNKRVPTPDLNRWLGQAVEQHAPPAAKGRSVKIRFMTQASARPPTFIAFCSQPEAVPKTYLRYLVNGLRNNFELAGTPIRLKLRKSANPFASR